MVCARRVGRADALTAGIIGRAAGDDVELIVEAVFGRITAALARGQRVELRGFGAFTVKQREARTGGNPLASEEAPVSAKAVPAFLAGGALIEWLTHRGRDV
jgi:integration host factor subunit beta